MVEGVWRLRKELQSAEEKLAQLLQKNKELEGKLAELDTKEGVEREAKERLNLKNTGESVVVLVPEKDVLPEGKDSGFASFWGWLKKFIWSIRISFVD